MFSQNLLRVPSVLFDLQASETKEEEISALTVLNEVISSNRAEIELLYKLRGLHIIIKKMRNDERIINLSLKILVTVCKKDKKIRKNLLENDIFGVLAIQLQNEYNFTMNNIILYTALIVIVVQGNEEAQYLMRTSGCLSSLVLILNHILDHSETDGIPEKNTEMIIYAITSTIKNPRNAENQVEIRWIVGKVINYLGTFSQLDNHIVMCFWSFLRNILDKNEINQEIFLRCSGLIVLFRSLQEIIDDKKCQKFEGKLSKITGVLVKLKSHKEFLNQSSNYCSIMILCLLMKNNSSLVMQHVITFFSSLIREIPSTLNILKDSQIQIVMRKALTAYSAENTIGNLVQDLWEALETSLSLQQGFPTFDGSFKPVLSSNQILESRLLEAGSLYYPQSARTDFCILHSSYFSKELQIYSSSLLNCSQQTWVNMNETGRKYESWKSLNHRSFQRMQLAIAHLNLHRRELKKKEQKLRKKIRQSLFPVQTFKNDKPSSNIITIASRKIFQVLKKFWSCFSRTRSLDVVEWKRSVIKSCQFVKNQLFENY